MLCASRDLVGGFGIAVVERGAMDWVEGRCVVPTVVGGVSVGDGCVVDSSVTSAKSVVVTMGAAVVTMGAAARTLSAHYIQFH